MPSLVPKSSLTTTPLSATLHSPTTILLPTATTPPPMPTEPMLTSTLKVPSTPTLIPTTSVLSTNSTMATLTFPVSYPAKAIAPMSQSETIEESALESSLLASEPTLFGK